jgi:D-beta-D-heptose 7-phosphate kinase/D-beta-D-heptose 1-phosphate adenosyltransferase
MPKEPTHPSAHARIITNLSEVPAAVTKFRSSHKKIVLTQGVFDMVHIGHARYCDKAKEYGDILIVGVDSDEKVRLRKGPDRPVVPQDERMEMLTYLKSVDLVVLKEKDSPTHSLIEVVRPDVLVMTQESFAKKAPKQIKELKKLCGKVVVLEPMATTSTSAKIRLLQIGAAKKISATLSEKLIKTVEDVLQELKGEK